jgi:hypothetical protein
MKEAEETDFELDRGVVSEQEPLRNILRVDDRH